VDNAITKKKHYELGPARVNLEGYIQTGIVDLSDKLKELWSKCTAADELADAATGGEGLEGLESWRNLLAQKMTWLRAVGCAVTHDANTYDCAQEPVVPGTMSDPDYNFISKLNASVLAAITNVAIGAEANTEGAADGDQLEKAQAACVAISAAATAGPMDLSSSVALPVLARFGWTGLASPGGSGFTSPPAFFQLAAELERTLACLKISFRLHDLIKSQEESKQPMPVEDAWSLTPVNALALMHAAVLLANSEDDIKSVKTEFDKAKVALVTLFKVCDGAAKQVSTFIETRTKKLKNDQVKKLKEAERETLKCERQKQKELLASKKHQTDTTNTTGSAGPLCGARAPSVLFSLQHDKIEDLSVFSSPDVAMAVQGSGERRREYFKLHPEPYIIQSMAQLRDVANEKDLKAALAIFQVQFAGSVQAKQKGCGQTPLQIQKKEKARELMLEAMPPVARDVNKDAIMRRFAETVSICGQLPQCVVNGEVEKQGAATSRYQLKGCREVYFIDYTEVKKLLKMSEHFEGDLLDA
jgi:hypothetical protein